MCIIVAKPSGVKFPDIETFRSCAESNRDGIGFSYAKPGDIPSIVKGIANPKKLMERIETMKIGEEENVVVHFRLATHGKVDQGNCHPFPLTDDINKLRLLYCKSFCTVAHNGVFHDQPRHEKISDTGKFILNILAYPEIAHNLDSKPIRQLLKAYCGNFNKLAFLRPSGITLIGEFQEENGVFYSNHQFKKHTYYRPIYRATEELKKHYCNLHKAKTEKINQLEFKPLIKMKCIWCAVSEQTKYNEDAGGYLCDECVEIMSKYGS